jgi:hypothetical protein
MGHKRASGRTPSGSVYSKGETVKKSVNASLRGNTGAVKTGPGNPKTGMGVKKGKAGRMSQSGDAGSFAAGRSRTNRGKNNTGSGTQGFRG